MIYKKDLLERIEELEDILTDPEKKYLGSELDIKANSNEINNRVDNINQFCLDLIESLNLDFEKYKSVKEHWLGDRIITRYKFSKVVDKKKK